MALRFTIRPMGQPPLARETLEKCRKSMKKSGESLNYCLNKYRLVKSATNTNDQDLFRVVSTSDDTECVSNINVFQKQKKIASSYNYNAKAQESYQTDNSSNISKGKLIGRRLESGKFLKPKNLQIIDKKNINLSCAGESVELIGLVLGVFHRKDDPYGSTKTFTKFAEEIDIKTNRKISDILDTTGPIPRRGQQKILYKLDPMYPATVIVGIGDECACYNEKEEIDEMKENVRDAAALGVRTLQELNMKTILIDSMGSAEASAEGSALGVWRFQELKHIKKQILIPRLELHGDCDYTAWQIGLQKAAAQNLARQLCETPANLLTPLGFAQAAVEVLSKAGVNVEVKGKDWAKIMQMGGFLAASKGSCENPIFLEISYYGCDPDVPPAVLVGKGVTFDSGGLCLKHPCNALKYMRGDMAGAACVVAATRAAAALRLPINIRGLLPIYENLPGSCAMKPGDIVRVKNGKSVLIHNTDHDGRLSMADALCHATEYNPKFILDIGTLSKELLESLGPAASAAFSNNDSLFQTLKNAAVHTGDRVWRLPLWNHFSHKVTLTQSADVQDKAVDTGLVCTCAAFLKEFIPPVDWLHIDTYATAVADGHTELYLTRGMSGRPTRTLVEFLAQLACHCDDESGPVKAENKQ